MKCMLDWIYSVNNVVIAAYKAWRPPIFARNISLIIWTPEVLINRCFDPTSHALDRKVTQRYPRKKIEPTLMALLRDHLSNYMEINRTRDRAYHFEHLSY